MTIPMRIVRDRALTLTMFAQVTIITRNVYPIYRRTRVFKVILLRTRMPIMRVLIILKTIRHSRRFISVKSVFSYICSTSPDDYQNKLILIILLRHWVSAKWKCARRRY